MTIDEGKLVEPAERELHAAVQSSTGDRPLSVDEFLNTVVALIPSINAFFDQVLVMADDEQVRQNRLALVGQIASLSSGIADLSKLEGF